MERKNNRSLVFKHVKERTRMHKRICIRFVLGLCSGRLRDLTTGHWQSARLPVGVCTHPPRACECRPPRRPYAIVPAQETFVARFVDKTSDKARDKEVHHTRSLFPHAPHARIGYARHAVVPKSVRRCRAQANRYAIIIV